MVSKRGWGRENAVILFRSTRAEFPPCTQTLSIKRAWGGHEDYVLASRRLTVGDERTLILNEGAHYAARIASPTPVTSLGVFFRPRMAEELAGAAAQSTAELLAREHESVRASCGFAEHLRPIGAPTEALLMGLRDAVMAGDHDVGWLEEQLQSLLWTLLRAEPGWRARRQSLAGACRSAHTELLARVDHATDYILSCHTQPLALDDIAQAARLSKYHLVRMFRQVHGTTPMAFLTRVRTRQAERLVRDTSLSLSEVVEVTGLGSRQTLFRPLRIVQTGLLAACTASITTGSCAGRVNSVVQIGQSSDETPASTQFTDGQYQFIAALLQRQVDRIIFRVHDAKKAWVAEVLRASSAPQNLVVEEHADIVAVTEGELLHLVAV